MLCLQKRESSDRRTSVMEQSRQEVNDQRLSCYQHAVIRFYIQLVFHSSQVGYSLSALMGLVTLTFDLLTLKLESESHLRWEPSLHARPLSFLGPAPGRTGVMLTFPFVRSSVCPSVTKLNFVNTILSWKQTIDCFRCRLRRLAQVVHGQGHERVNLEGQEVKGQGHTTQGWDSFGLEAWVSHNSRLPCDVGSSRL